MNVKPALRDLLDDPGAFIFGAEVVTSRGIITQKDNAKIRALAQDLVASHKYHTINFTDNAGGRTAFSPETLLEGVLAAGGIPILHLTCKDKNRAALESLAYKLASKGLEGVLALTGDAPHGGFQGTARRSFDYDSVNLVVMLRQMNQGVEEVRPNGKVVRYDPTKFIVGVAVNPYKRHEEEQIPQYVKLELKIRQGADFVIPQLGYDVRKLDELLRYMRLRGIPRPVLGNIFVLSRATARLFHEGKIPGCACSDELLALAEKQAAAPDKGRKFFLELAAKQAAVARGIGCKGAYIGGLQKIADFEAVADIWRTFGSSAWKDFVREISFSLSGQFQVFERDPATGLNTDRLDPAYEASLAPRARQRLGLPLAYRFNHWIHRAVFEPGTAGFALGQALYRGLDKRPLLAKLAHRAEKAVKGTLFDCHDCGDCALPAMCYLCPESQCGKNQRNGPCGGTQDGRCEVDPEKECVYGRIYRVEKALGQELARVERPVIFTDGGLQFTSSWRHVFAGQPGTAGAETQTPVPVPPPKPVRPPAAPEARADPLASQAQKSLP